MATDPQDDRTVLVAVDGSEAAKHAVAVAGRLFPVGALTLVDVIAAREDPMAAAGGFEGPAMTEDEATELHRADRVEAEAALADAAQVLGDVPVHQTVVEHSGEGIGARLCTYAEEAGADVLVVGSHGHRTLVDILFGSVATHVTHHSTVPVLVVRPPAH